MNQHWLENQHNDFDNFNVKNINSITLKTSAVNDNQVNRKSYVDQFHQENERAIRDIGIDFYNESGDLVKKTQDNNFNDYKSAYSDSITVDRDPSSDDGVANKKYIDNTLDKKAIL